MPGLRVLLLVVLVGCTLYSSVLLFNVPIPDTLTWYGDETWLTREFSVQVVTGHFHYPEAFGAVQSIGSGVLFNNMWITAIAYGLPITLLNGNPVMIGRAVSVLVSLLILFVLYRQGRKMGASPEATSAALILLVCSGTFTYGSHSARYDILTALAVLITVLWCVRICTMASDGGQREEFELGALAVLTFLVTPHVILCTVLVLTFTASTLIRERGGSVVARIAVGSLSTVALILLLYIVTGNTDWTFKGPAPVGSSALHADSAYFPIQRWHGLHTVLTDISLVYSICRGYAVPLLLGLLLAIPLLVVQNWKSRLMITKASCVILVLIAYVLLEIRDVRSFIYVAPILTLITLKGFSFISTVPRKDIQILLLITPVAIAVPYFLRHGENGRRLSDELVMSSSNAYRQIADRIGKGIKPNEHTLVDSHGMTYLLRSGVHPMADIFAWNAATRDSVGEVLRKSHVRYIVRLRANERRYESYYRHELDRYLYDHSVEVERFVGNFSDFRVSYHDGSKSGPDTILVSQLTD